jgi:hypothetical protein
MVVPELANEETTPFACAIIETLSLVKFTTGASCAPSDTPTCPPVALAGK